MKTKILHKSDSDFRNTVLDTFNNGGIISYPTETFFGLMANPFNEEAINKIYKLKDRATNLALPIIIGTISQLKLLTDEVNDNQKKLIERFWPGPLTIIFEAKDNLPRDLTAGLSTVAIRFSSNDIAKTLSLLVDSPITATSANPSGLTPARTAEEVKQYFNGKIDLIVDEKCGSKDYEPTTEGSTIVDVLSNHPVILREGIIKKEEVFSTIRKAV